MTSPRVWGSQCAQRMPGVNRDDTEIVSAIIRAIAEQVGQDRFQMWLGGATIRVENHRLLVGATEAFKLERIRRIFRGDLIAAAERVLGYEPELVLAIDDAVRKAAQEAKASQRADDVTSSEKQLELFADPGASPESDE